MPADSSEGDDPLPSKRSADASLATVRSPQSGDESDDPPHTTPASTNRLVRWLGSIPTFQSLIEVPAFRWYLVAVSGNTAAMQMQNVARGLLTYQLTGSYAALGFVELANTFPRLLFALTGGVVADRTNRRLIVQIGQATNAVIVAIIAGLLFMEALRFEHLVIAAVLQAVANSFALPARQAMIPDVVGLTFLNNAFALNVSLMSTLRLGAPALAGVLVAVVGASWVFALMAGLFTFAVLMLFRVPPTPKTERPVALDGVEAPLRRPVTDILDALRYIWRNPMVRMVLIVDMFLGMLTFPYQRLLPGFVTDMMSSSDSEAAVRTGVLLAITAAGGIAGSLVVASRPNRHRGLFVIGSVVLFGVALFAFSLSTVFLVSCGIVVFLGAGQAIRQALNNIIIQSNVDNDFRGRVSSIMLFEDGIESLGIFFIALLASARGPQFALATTAVLMLGIAATMWLLMPSYRRLQ